MHLRNRTAVVTGASMGIGAATAVALAEQGVTVWAVARNRERLSHVASRASGIHPIVADITNEMDRARLVDAIGETDIVVNNAGSAVAGMVESTSLSTVRDMYELNLFALIDITQRFLPHMLRRRSGHICNVGSSVSYLAAPPLTLYASTKYAVEGFTDGLRRELSSRGIGVSLIQPGPVKTGFWDRALSGDRPDINQFSGNGIPAEWVAKAIVKAIRYDNVPGYRHVAVPRPVGLGRLLDVPGVAFLVDTANRFRTPKDVRRVIHRPDGPDAEVIHIADRK